MSKSLWEAEASRGGAEYVRWVQDSLNRILGLRLAVDGRMGPATRSAIRSFQQKQGLAADGTVGPKTEAAIRAALPSTPVIEQPVRLDSSACVGLRTPEVLDGFAYDRDALQPSHYAQIEKIAQCVVATQSSTRPIRAIRLVGHTDPAGPDWYNLQLGQRRAEQVRRELARALERIRPGLKGVSISVESAGERSPLSGDPARSRRVEVFSDGGRPSVCQPDDPVFIRWVQSALATALGTRVPVSGRLDVPTRRALRSFQARLQLSPSGLPDSATQRALVNAGAPLPRCNMSNPCDGPPQHPPIRSGNLTFYVCSVMQLDFNSGPGRVGWGDTSFRTLWFRTGNASGRPAWGYAGIVAVDEVIPPGRSSVLPDWDYGFIQTVQSLQWFAVYGRVQVLGLPASIVRSTAVNNARDVVVASAPAPWINRSESPSGPQPFSKEPPTAPIHGDEPMLKVAVRHPTASDFTLCRVISSGTFHLWLIAKNRNQPAELANLVFLHHKTISFRREWQLPPSGDPTRLDLWIASGSQTIVTQGAGRGQATPVLETPVANTVLQGGLTDVLMPTLGCTP